MIDLSQYVDKQIEVRLRDGSRVTRVVSKSASECYPFLFNGEAYTQEGRYYQDCREHNSDIIAVEKPDVNLSQFINKNVRVTLRDGTVSEGDVNLSRNSDFPYEFDGTPYVVNGQYYHSELDYRDIVAIEEIKPEATLSALQERRDQLEAELEEVEQQIRIENGPDGLSAEEVFNFLQTGSRESASLMFSWNSTPQGWDHWSAIRYGDKEVSREDIEYLVNCLLKHFLRKFE